MVGSQTKGGAGLHPDVVAGATPTDDAHLIANEQQQLDELAGIRQSWRYAEEDRRRRYNRGVEDAEERLADRLLEIEEKYDEDSLELTGLHNEQRKELLADQAKEILELEQKQAQERLGLTGGLRQSPRGSRKRT